MYAIVQGSHKQQIVGGVQLMEVFCGHTELAPQELRALDAESGLHFEGHLFWGRRRVRHAASENRQRARVGRTTDASPNPPGQRTRR